jgi:hypothetical protein
MVNCKNQTVLKIVQISVNQRISAKGLFKIWTSCEAKKEEEEEKRSKLVPTNRKCREGCWSSLLHILPIPRIVKFPKHDVPSHYA